jgi:hypothetical protein
MEERTPAERRALVRARVEELIGSIHMPLYDLMQKLPKKIMEKMARYGDTKGVELVPPDTKFRAHCNAKMVQGVTPRSSAKYFRAFAARYLIPIELHVDTMQYPDYAYAVGPPGTPITKENMLPVPRSEFALVIDNTLHLDKYYRAMSVSDIPLYEPVPGGRSLHVCSARHVIEAAKKQVERALNDEETANGGLSKQKREIQDHLREQNRLKRCYEMALDLVMKRTSPETLPVLMRASSKRMQDALRGLLDAQYVPADFTTYTKGSFAPPSYVIEHNHILSMAIRLASDEPLPEILESYPLIQALFLLFRHGVDQGFPIFLRTEGTDSEGGTMVEARIERFRTTPTAKETTQRINDNTDHGKKMWDLLHKRGSALVATSRPFVAAMQIIEKLGSITAVQCAHGPRMPVCALTGRTIQPGQWAWFIQCSINGPDNDMLQFFVLQTLPVSMNEALKHTEDPEVPILMEESDAPEPSPDHDYMDDVDMPDAVVPAAPEPEPEPAPKPKSKKRAPKKPEGGEVVAAKPKKSKTPPATDPDPETAPPPAKKARVSAATPTTQVPQIVLASQDWPVGTKLRWPDGSIMVVNPVFKVLMDRNKPLKNEDFTNVFVFQELLRLDGSNENNLFNWGSDHKTEFHAILKLLQVLCPPSTSATPVPDLSTIEGRLLKRQMDAGYLPQTKELEPYLHKTSKDISALAGLIALAQSLVDETYEPIGGHALNDFINKAPTKTMAQLTKAFQDHAPDPKTGQENAMMVMDAFRTLFYC